ncbi:NAD(P)/FAD-dependent oxidoreductase [Nitrosomonas eutropha]|uniref:Rubredoxin-NAD+ reductase n=2 Tax=Nitrosomonas eutropha TaxID=916 RepID=A0ABX5MBD3_9PROT|nr:FAD-dependent oxidoreductase [Nitrosomonas eutropha]ABI59778.1 FAD-dependent pyridine nucleotide-disulfide oxidoreductase [Nitrosomonas eutropha C91]PXV83634.1 rubredoxin-NAD+ reductase [Nitrosomonas eutropha]SEI57375.1 rubredoxin-NAD+ reductase [Nitrosomonas eutropha]
MSQLPVVVIGSGLAGYTVVRELRRLDSAVPITLLSADHGGFYSKPMLSNALATGKTPDSILSASSEQMSGQLGITVQPYTRVDTLDVAANNVYFENGTQLTYGRLVLALGADPMRLPIPGSGADDMLSINDLDDYRRFRENLENKRHVAILGAGLIGCEFANDLVVKGYQVSVFDLSPQPLGRLLPSEAGHFFREKLSTAGVKFLLGTTVEKISKENGYYHLYYKGGGVVQADMVLSAIGLKPRTGLAEAAGIQINRGITVDRYLQSSIQNIYALGDCAEVAGKVLPFILPISHAGRALAATIAGNQTLLRYPAMPVMVKTPACPAVISPPDPGVEGEWKIQTVENGMKALYQDEAGNLHGFALLGTATNERNALVALLPPVLA